MPHTFPSLAPETRRTLKRMTKVADPTLTGGEPGRVFKILTEHKQDIVKFRKSVGKDPKIETNYGEYIKKKKRIDS